MKLFRVCKTETKALLQNKFKIIAIIAVIFIPLLYTFSYLKAYWDPYGDLKDYHIAIINNDLGATLDGKTVNYGNDTVDNLKNESKIGFDFVDKSTAANGLKNDIYFASIEIPKDFSEKIAKAKDGNAISPIINFTSNNKKNYIGTKISESIKNEILNEIKESISKEYGEIAFTSIYETRDGLKEASEGTEELIDGTNKINDGNNKITDGLDKLNSQIPRLQNGVNDLSNGTAALNDGLNQLSSKVPKLATPINDLASGANKLNAGIDSANKGATELSNKSQELLEANTKINDTYNNSITTGYKTMASALNNGSKQLVDGAKGIQNAVDQLLYSTSENQQAITDAQKYLQAYLASNPEAMTDANMQAYLSTMQAISEKASDPSNASKIQALKDGTAALSTGTEALSYQLDISNSDSAVSTFNNGLNTFNLEALEPFSIGLNQYLTGVNQLSSGLNDLSEGSSKISSGLTTLNSNMPSLIDASKQLYDGSSALNNGVNELNSKMPDLASGTKKLLDGSTELGDGLNTLNNGQKELNTALNDGIKEINDNVKTSSEDLGRFIGEPVKVDITNIDEIDNYGTGLAPYFLPISLWLGAVLMMLIIKVKNNKYPELNRLQLTIGKYIHYGVLGIIQALLLGGIVYLLGIKPAHPTLLFGFLIVMALSFDAILYGLVSILGLVGEGVSIILLVLQLCSDAGTFPMEVLPKFFQDISTYLPFTYAVEIAREVLFASTVDISLIMKDLLMLGLFAIIALVFAFIFSRQGVLINNIIEEAINEPNDKILNKTISA